MRITDSFKRVLLLAATRIHTLTDQLYKLHASGVFRPGRQLAFGAEYRFQPGHQEIMNTQTLNLQARMAGPATVIGFVLLASTVNPQDTGFKLVVQESNLTVSITRAEAAEFFLKQTKAWPTGEAVAPVDQGEKSAVRRAFSKAVLKKDIAAVRGYWQAQVFSGRGLPAPERQSDASVLAFVQSTPGAIGYVSFGADVGKGVKEIEIR